MRLNHLVYGLWLVAAAAATFSCGGDDAAPGSGGTSGKGSTAGSGGSSGSSAGGKNAGGGNPAGGAPSAQGGASDGGMPSLPEGGANLGMGGDASGGQGGAGPVSKCGNGVIDPGERCDPAVASNACSATCTFTACDACMATNFPAQSPLATALNPTGGGDCALAGSPARTAACQAVLDCAAAQHCVAADKFRPDLWDASLACFCGPGMTYEACKQVATTSELLGACKDEIRAAANDVGGELTPSVILTQFHEDGSAIGEALKQLDNPGPLPIIGCDARLTSASDRQLCSDVLDCALKSHCATGGSVDACYCGDTDSSTCFLTINDASDPRLNGPCKDVIQRAAGGPSVIPLQIATVLEDLEAPLGAALNEADQLDTNCNSECYPGGTP